MRRSLEALLAVTDRDTHVDPLGAFADELMTHENQPSQRGRYRRTSGRWFLLFALNFGGAVTDLSDADLSVIEACSEVHEECGLDIADDRLGGDGIGRQDVEFGNAAMDAGDDPTGHNMLEVGKHCLRPSRSPSLRRWDFHGLRVQCQLGGVSI